MESIIPFFSRALQSAATTTTSSSSPTTNNNMFGSGSPRFGHSNNFSDLFSSDDDVRKDYITGILIMALLLFSLFLIWGIVLLALKYASFFHYCCCGLQQVGFLSGAPFVETTTTTSRTTETTGRRKVVDPWIRTGQVTFGISLVMFVIFAILLVTVGIGNLDNTTTTIGNGAMVSNNIVDILDIRPEANLVQT